MFVTPQSTRVSWDFICLCGPSRQVTPFWDIRMFFSALSLASPKQLHSYDSSFIVFIMAVHVNLYAEILQHNEAQREQRLQPMMEQRLKPATGAAVDGVFRVAFFLFCSCSFTCAFAFYVFVPGFGLLFFSFRHLFAFISLFFFLATWFV